MINWTVTYLIQEPVTELFFLSKCPLYRYFAMKSIIDSVFDWTFCKKNIFTLEAVLDILSCLSSFNFSCLAWSRLSCSRFSFSALASDNEAKNSENVLKKSCESICFSPKRSAVVLNLESVVERRFSRSLRCADADSQKLSSTGIRPPSVVRALKRSGLLCSILLKYWSRYQGHKESSRLRNYLDFPLSIFEADSHLRYFLSKLLKYEI